MRTKENEYMLDFSKVLSSNQDHIDRLTVKLQNVSYVL
jgi:hypothetical protein